ncbi:MAG: DMT family transporter [Actinomycetota bacterium]|nr:DMT family transporter [Actinomycetota bacterium]
MAVFLGLAAALSYGAADFVGGFSTKKANVFIVVFVSQMAGTLLLLALFPALNDAAATSKALLWGGAAGLGGGVGVVLLYRGLAGGRMSVVAPITAVEAAAVPVLVGLATGERPSGLALAGVAVALVSVVLVSSSPHAEYARPAGIPAGVLEAVGAGIAFGLFFVFLAHAGRDTGAWPLIGTKIVSVVFVAVMIAVTRPSWRVSRATLRTIILAGVLDLSANVLYLAGSRRGLLSIVAVLTSLYPATTVVLARIVLKERFSSTQLTGLVCALVGIVFMASG